MVKTASVFSRLEAMEYLSGKMQGFTDKLLKMITYPEEGGVSRTNRATRIKSRVQNERICLILILVDAESTVCP